MIQLPCAGVIGSKTHSPQQTAYKQIRPFPMHDVCNKSCGRFLTHVAISCWTPRLQDEAVKVMDQFGWGAEFLRVNEDVLDTYAACADGAEVVKAQVSVNNWRPGIKYHQRVT